ncbi:MAG TPA: hypothetical protein PK033_07475 [Acetivibrio sp.]|nr:hypothetical protein [Clostridium sp.]HQA57703.1 hypothetical protein [Acetivibrio sp.]
MAEFCNCGSLMINGSCTNKNCNNRVSAKHASSAKRVEKEKASEKKSPSSTRTRRASKCITYNLKDLAEKVENI